MLARGQDSEMLRYTLGDAYFEQQQFEKAAEHLHKALEFKPDYSAGWRLLGKTLTALERYREASEAFDEGMRHAQNNGDIQALKEMTVFKRRAEKQLQKTKDAAAIAKSDADNSAS
ncbi:MAG: tetratricopeptide repeat protein [Granulosicoccus sp.]|nr:tetratricopeptide repeat protein [Granulosicoccus sp.]